MMMPIRRVGIDGSANQAQDSAFQVRFDADMMAAKGVGIIWLNQHNSTTSNPRHFIKPKPWSWKVVKGLLAKDVVEGCIRQRKCLCILHAELFYETRGGTFPQEPVVNI
jgi:hypothetical protein